MSETVLLVPKKKRAKERCKQHGHPVKDGNKTAGFVMVLVDALQDRVLVKSMDKTWSNGGRKEHWLGWFTHDEVDVKFKRS